MRRALRKLLLVTGLLALLGGAMASANHDSALVKRVSPGNGAFGAGWAGASEDGSQVFFHTQEKLVSADTDNSIDLYEQSNGVATLVSIGPSGGNGPYNARVASSFRGFGGAVDGVSRNGTRVLFVTAENLVSGDVDNGEDIYERSGGTTTLVSTGPTDPGVTDSVSFVGASADGGRVVFETDARLVSADTDNSVDVYERSGSTTTLLSTGPAGGNSPLRGAYFSGLAEDGTHVFFKTDERLVDEDSDGLGDVYEHSGGATRLVSTGPTANNGPYDAGLTGVSKDGTRAFFLTAEALVSTDTDSSNDLYERSGGNTTLISTGTTGGNGNFHAGPAGASSDGTRVFLSTREQLTSADGDASTDIYEHADGATVLVSTGSLGGNGPYDVDSAGVSEDGTHVFFMTAETLSPDDADGGGLCPDSDPEYPPGPCQDIYEHAGGTTKLVSIGPTGGAGAYQPSFAGASEDGARAFFKTSEKLVANDTDTRFDVYERFADTTTLISIGPAGGNGDFDAGLNTPTKHIRQNGTLYFFDTTEKLVGDDTDSASDIYVARVAPYRAPQSASSLEVALGPAFKQCGTAGNSASASHAPPLSAGSCAPPVPTTGSARFGSASVGSASLTVVPGDLTTTADEADVAIGGSMTDIETPAGSDYDPNPLGADLTLYARIRTTDIGSCSPAPCGGSYDKPATATEIDFTVPVTCTGTSDPSLGSTCAVSTTADTLMPGFVREGGRTVVQAFRFRVDDSGPNGIRADGDDRLFAQQGVYVP